jgi:predicted O-linked N-acetylglucosamine transferase (SPINDLY family)
VISAGALIAQGFKLHREGDLARAEELYRAAVRADPRNFEGFYLLGLLHGQKRQFVNSQQFVGEAIKLNPASTEALLLRAFALQQLERYPEALECLQRCLALKPDFAEALLNRASLLFRMRRYLEAATDYERLLALRPEYPFARGNLLFSRLHCCDWRDFDRLQSEIAADLAQGAQVIAPFDAKALWFAPADELACAEIWVADQCPAEEPLWRGEAYAHERIRVAYVSADFRAHAAATLTAALFERHDRRRFEVIGVSLGPDDHSPMRARLSSAFDIYLDVREKSDSDIAALLRSMEIDIAVDMMGFTEGCRAGIFARRPAPIQVNFLGFPGTMGASFIDYVIGDAVAIPERAHPFYREKVVTLPHSFMPSDSGRGIGTAVFSRKEEGLPGNGFVFCCFNASYKINPRIFDIWMRLLTQVPESVLWLGQANAEAQRHLRNEGQRRGVPAERLVFARYVAAAADHLSRLRLADLFLDTLPYNAHATANDALWAGLPVLTCAGAGFAGRVAASLLRSVGLPDLVTDSLQAYEDIALQLARDPDALASIRQKLARNRATAPLFDTSRYMRDLESAYAEMWRRWRHGLPAECFAVHDSAGAAP